MRPLSNSTELTIDVELQHCNSPLPYRVIGLGLLLGLIAIALGIMACSYIKSTSDDEDAEERSSGKEVEMHHVDTEPKIVVIMAGDTNPTYLAKPVSCTCQTEGSSSGKCCHT